jgi:hypothetical protein
MTEAEEKLARIRAIVPTKSRLLSDFLIAAMCLGLAGLWWCFAGNWKVMPAGCAGPTTLGIMWLTSFCERLLLRRKLLEILKPDSAEKRPIVRAL